MALLNRVGHATSTTGTGTVTLGSALSSHFTVAEAGGVDGTTYTYLIEDGLDFEIGRGVYTASGTTLTRATVIASKISGTAGTSKINLSGAATVKIAAAKEDLVAFGATGDLTLESTDAGAAAGPILTLYRNSASPAANDVIGQVLFTGEDSAGNTQTYASIQSIITDPTSTSEDGEVRFSVVTAGTLADEMRLSGSALLPSADGGLALGGSGLQWQELYLNDGRSIYWNGATAFLRHGSLSGGAEIIVGHNSDVTRLTLDAGSASVEPLKFVSGPLRTVAQAGALEYDGNCYYGTDDAGTRGVIPRVHFAATPVGNYTLANSAAEQALFTGANDTLTLDVGLYIGFWLIHLTSMSATSGNAAFDLLGAGTATITRLDHIVGIDAATIATPAAQQGSFNVAQTSASLATAATATVMAFRGYGAFRVTAGGTIIPSITLVTAAAAVVNNNSHFMCFRLGDATAQAIGAWA